MLSAYNLNKHYLCGGEKIDVLRDIDLQIDDGEFLAIVGRSGSGKTTLLHVLSTLVQPDQGQLIYNENDLTVASNDHLNSLRQHDFAVIFQFHHLLPYLTVLQNTLLPFMRSVVPVSKEIVERAEQCLERIGLYGKKDRLPGSLSGGEQQRVAIARAMVKSAKVLFADEPTGSLDQGTGEEIMNLIEELNADGLTVVMVTHEPTYAERAGRLVEMSDGVIV
jgi:putative ABC transport system ATP-binding protein